MVLGVREPAFAAIEHRPWPIPGRPWLQRQTWSDLLFMHWPVALEDLRAAVPERIPLDTYEGQAWLGIVPFTMSGVRPRWLMPVRGISGFPEVNVRTYVTLEGKPGVYFFSLDAGNRIAVALGRRMFNLPYFRAAMRTHWERGWVVYRSRRDHPGAYVARLSVRYRPLGPTFHPCPGTLEWFLTERYCLYNLDRAGRVRRLEIQHPPWSLQAAEVDIEANSLHVPSGVRLPDTAPLVHFARRQDMVGWMPEFVPGRSDLVDQVVEPPV